MVPASWRYMKKMSGTKLREFSNQLRYIEMGSANFTTEEKMELAALLPETRICMHYGLTEASRSAFMEFHKDKDYLCSVGRPTPNTIIKIFDEQGIEVPTGEEGEICIKGDHVTCGYINALNELSYFDDYFRTGDWGHKDREGYLYLTSRKKDLINVGGKKVSPMEVETLIQKVPGVLDCACVGIPDKEGYLGEVVKAYVVKETGSSTTFDEILSQITGKIEYYKLPVQWSWVEEIPKTQNGKILRHLLV